MISLNQKGSIHSIGVLLLFLSSILFIHFVYSHIVEFNKIQSKFDFYLCAKKFNRLTQNYINSTNKLNLILKYPRAADLVVFVPGGATLKAAKDLAIKAIIVKQNIELVSYLKNIFEIKAKSCAKIHCSAIVPYKVAGISYQRDPNNKSLLLKKRNWTCLAQREKNILKIYYSLQSAIDRDVRFQIEGMVLP